MNCLQTFLARICGTFDNQDQIHGPTLPNAQHIATPCNERILHLPADFQDVFVIDETYYHYFCEDKQLHHLYRYGVDEDGRIQMASYEIPTDFDETMLRSDVKWTLDYRTLRKKGMEPILFHYDNGIFHCEGACEIHKDVQLYVRMRIEEDAITLIEAMYHRDFLVSGFEEPLHYKRRQS